MITLYSSHAMYMEAMGGVKLTQLEQSHLVKKNRNLYIVDDTEHEAVNIGEVNILRLPENDDISHEDLRPGDIMVLCKKPINGGMNFVDNMIKGLAMLFHQNVNLVYLTDEGFPICMDQMVHATKESSSYVYLSNDNQEPEWLSTWAEMTGIKSLKGGWLNDIY